MTERFILPNRLDSSAAAALAAALLERRGHGLDLDASEVEVMGALAMEVLIAAGRQWSADGQTLAIQAPSLRYAAACEAMGLAPDAPWIGVAAKTGDAA
ncbi:STAS domain-containing protein [Paragemmobacter ruber]|uniref:STAS domain-containing protein n=1 Tax=Paragemmobacter ruber TaxID=1985673 RepID=A0ABW9YAQ5_9RHOB|nr:STAS domain-containing protein [Rhodobacter ruber]NBE09528.1 STAS domain-containing protein [Rhodobacter ruber]